LKKEVEEEEEKEKEDILLFCLLVRPLVCVQQKE
jgi:hypothetical protein